MILRNAGQGVRREWREDQGAVDPSVLETDDFFNDIGDEGNDDDTDFNYHNPNIRKRPRFDGEPIPRARGRGRPRGSRGARGSRGMSLGRGSGLGRGSHPRGSGLPRGRPRGRGRGMSAALHRERSPSPTSSQFIGSDPRSLYEVVRQGRTSLQVVVDEWIENYKQDRDSALLDLMQFFIQSAGCKSRITPDMQQNMDHTQIIRKMTEEFDEDSGDYPLVIPGPQWKKFRQNFCEFVQVLVRQCQYSIIYDQHLMDNLITLLTGLSDSQVRAFRHTATLAAMKLMTALVDVALNLSINLDNTQRQYDAERQKNRDKRATERLELLLTKRKELEDSMEEIKNMQTYMFKSVFVHRYRDSLPDIRAICMVEIGHWMKKFHSQFLEDSFLKYLGWTLHDKVGDVRLKCLQALLPLYTSEELTSKMELFSNKFKERIVEMTLDKDYDVAVSAVRLVILIHKYHREVLTDKDCEHVYELVYSSHRAVAQAAGEFLNERLFQPDQEAITKTRRGKRRSVNTPLIRDLVQFFIESELHEHGAYLVDSLIDSNLMMKDWECMTDLLLEEPGPEEEALDNKQETSLIEIMVCCMKQAATGEPPVGRGPCRKTLSAKESKQVQDDRVKLTEHFIQTLPLLIHKYMADAEKIANLMLMPQYFELEIYTTSRQENALQNLLKLINEIVERHTDTEVLENCAKTYEAFIAPQLAIESRCVVSRSALIDNLVTRYKTAQANWADSGEDAGEDEIFAIESSLKKLEVFHNAHNLGPWTIWKDIYESWVRAAVTGERGQLPLQAVRHAIALCHHGIQWDLNSILENTQIISVQTLREKVFDFLACMSQLLEKEEDLIKEEAFISICDTLIFYSRELGQSEPMCHLIYDPPDAMMHALIRFVDTKVFVSDADDGEDEHHKIEELHKRRNFLASFCKLAVYNIIPINALSGVFKNYLDFYNDYGDIIKATLGKAREINRVKCAQTMLEALMCLFDQCPRDQMGVVNRQSDKMMSIKELSKRYGLLFGFDHQKNRDAIIAMHQNGIMKACTPKDNPNQQLSHPPNLAFLEVMYEFVNKLTKNDKKIVLAMLDQHIHARLPVSRHDDWQPLTMYRTALMHGETEAPQRFAVRQYRPRKRAHDDDEDDVDDDDDLE